MHDLTASVIKAQNELLAWREAIEQMPNRRTDPLYGRIRTGTAIDTLSI